MTGFTVDDLLAQYPIPIREAVLQLREIILEATPESTEKANRGWRSISFRHPQVGYFCGIFPFEDRVDLIFEFGVLLPDPQGLLLGDAKQVRYLTFPGSEEVSANMVRPFVEAALDLPTGHAARRGLTQAKVSQAKKGGSQGRR